MPRKRKQVYPPAKTATKRAPAPTPDPNQDRPNLARINTAATTGRAGFSVGDRVRIQGSGTNSGEIGTIERLSGSVIPSALVRTASGGARMVRTIDLVAATDEPAPKTEPTGDSPPAE